MFEQKKNLKIEDAINDVLSGDTQKNALDFIAFLRVNKIPPKLYVVNIVGDGGNIETLESMKKLLHVFVHSCIN